VGERKIKKSRAVGVNNGGGLFSPEVALTGEWVKEPRHNGKEGFEKVPMKNPIIL